VGAILDIILSLALRGAIVLAVLNMTVSLQGKLSEKTAQAIQLNLANTMSSILRYDMEKVGYNWSVGPPYFSVASADTIEFVYSSTQPPNASSAWRVNFYTNNGVLYKIVNGGSPTAVASGVAQLKFKYFDNTGASTTVLSNIKSFSVDLIMASSDKVNGVYPASEWSCRFFPVNIN
jgi:hypothetical protein